MSLRLQVLRTLDKVGRLKPPDIYALLTSGRMDPSGDFTPGCNLTPSQALFLMDSVGIVSPLAKSRMAAVDVLASIAIEETTALDVLVERCPNSKEFCWAIDDLISIARDDNFFDERHSSPAPVLAESEPQP